MGKGGSGSLSSSSRMMHYSSVVWRFPRNSGITSGGGRGARRGRGRLSVLCVTGGLHRFFVSMRVTPPCGTPVGHHHGVHTSTIKRPPRRLRHFLSASYLLVAALLLSSPAFCFMHPSPSTSLRWMMPGLRLRDVVEVRLRVRGLPGGCAICWISRLVVFRLRSD